MADALKLNQPWDEVKEKIKETNVTLTDEDLEYSPGKEDELFERLSKALHKTPDEVKGWIESVGANKAKAG